MLEFYFDPGFLPNDSSGYRIGSCSAFETTLPQHHGLPTRVLDWSSNPRKAAFFAANGRDYNTLKVQEMAVYAIKEIKTCGPILIENNHARHKHKFLHAQDGLFTKLYGDIYFLNHGKWPSVENLHQETKGEFLEIKKFILPVEYKQSVLTNLERCGISRPTLMPHYNSVAEHIIG